MTMRRWRHLLGGAGLAVLLFGATPCVAGWQKATSAHFVIYADIRPDKLRNFATRIEQFDSALRRIFGIQDTEQLNSRRVTIYMLDDQSDVSKIYGKGGSSIAGFYAARASGSVAFVHRENSSELGDLSGEQVLLHEYAHHFMFEHWPETPSPSWFIEGFAEFNATASFEKDGSILLGKTPLYRAGELLDPQISTQKMLDSDVADLKADVRTSLYARGWLLTHYLLTQPAQLPHFAVFIDALNAGATPSAAAAKAFGDTTKLDRELRKYMTVRLNSFRVPASALAVAPITVEALPAGADAMMPARMASARGVRSKEDAAKIVERARAVAAQYPNDAFVQDALAEAEFDAGNLAESGAAAAKAAQLDAQSVHARLYQGMAATALLVKANNHDDAAWRQARNHYLSANRIDPNNAEALMLYYRSFVAEGIEPTKNAQAALLRAFEIAPFDSGLRMTAAFVVLAQRDTKRAETLLSTMAYNPHESRRSKLARAVLDKLHSDGPDAALALFRADGDDSKAPAASGN